MRVSVDRHGLTVHYRRRQRPAPVGPVWTDAQAAQAAPRPAAVGPAPDPVEVVAGEAVFTKAVEGHRVELLEVDLGGYVIVVDGHPVESLSCSPCAAAAAFGRYVGAVQSRPVLRLLEAVNP